MRISYRVDATERGAWRLRNGMPGSKLVTTRQMASGLHEPWGAGCCEGAPYCTDGVWRPCDGVPGCWLRFRDLDRGALLWDIWVILLCGLCQA